MTRLSTALLGFCFALAFGTFGAKATTYDFIETSCVSDNGGCIGLSLPSAIATFSSPDPSGQYQFDSIGIDPPNESGDTNFSLQWFLTGDAPVAAGGCPDAQQQGCEWNISWGGGSVLVEFMQPFFSANIMLPFIGSDVEMAGCGFFAECMITGSWVPEVSGVPEVSSVALLGGALGLFALIFGVAGTRNRPVALHRGRGRYRDRQQAARSRLTRDHPWRLCPPVQPDR